MIIGLMAPYKGRVSISLLCHFLMAIFTIVSIPLIIPFFHFLFQKDIQAPLRPDSMLDVVSWLEFFFTDMIMVQGTEKALLTLCGLIVVVFFFKNLFRYLAQWFMIPVRSNILSDLRQGLYHDYLHSSYALNEARRGDLITRMTSDVQEVEFSILRFMQTFIKAPLIICGSVFLMLSIHKGLTLFVFILMIFTALVIGSLSKTLKKESSRLQSTLGEMTNVVDETLDGSRLLRVFRVQDE